MKLQIAAKFTEQMLSEALSSRVDDETLQATLAIVPSALFSNLHCVGL